MGSAAYSSAAFKELVSNLEIRLAFAGSVLGFPLPLDPAGRCWPCPFLVQEAVAGSRKTSSVWISFGCPLLFPETCRFILKDVHGDQPIQLALVAAAAAARASDRDYQPSGINPLFPLRPYRTSRYGSDPGGPAWAGKLRSRCRRWHVRPRRLSAC